jgi:3-hydroxyacyl-CoA dehydrogenase
MKPSLEEWRRSYPDPVPFSYRLVLSTVMVVSSSSNGRGGMEWVGVVVNALLIPFILAAVRMLESGFASREDIDEGLVRGAAHPQGPLAPADLIGLDTTKAIAESLYAEFKEPLYAPPPLLARMVDAGLLGRKSGRGFYIYA